MLFNLLHTPVYDFHILIIVNCTQMIRLTSRSGWCGDSIEPGGNWVMLDLKAPTVIRGFRTQSTPRPDGTLAFTSAVRIQVIYFV